jgi:hypothetical protein
MCENLTVRRAIKQGSGIPTIPVSTSHQNGDWIPTDIYVGEQYLDTDTGIVYTRNGNDIEIVGGGQGQPKVWKCKITQTGTSAPVLNVLVNTLGITGVPSYDSVGAYFVTGFGFSDITNVTVEHSFVFEYFDQHSIVFFVDLDTLQIETTSNNIGVDGLLDYITSSNTITVTKYD